MTDNLKEQADVTDIAEESAEAAESIGEAVTDEFRDATEEIGEATELVETAAGEETEPEKPAREVGGGRETFGFAIRGLAGVYIIYLAYKIMKDMIEKGDIRWPMVLACVLFVAAGGFFIFLTLRYMMRVRNENLAEAERQEKEALEREKLFAENPELKAQYEAKQAEKAASQATAAGNGGRRGLFGSIAGPAAAEMQPRSRTGSDIRERLRQMNEEDGLETEEITAYEEDET